MLAGEFDPKDLLEKLDDREERHPRSEGQIDWLSIRDTSSNAVRQDFCHVAHVREISGLVAVTMDLQRFTPQRP